MKRTGIDPQVPEEIIIECLDQCVDEQQHASGVLMAVIDAWDREITRDQFIALASAAITCADNMGRHSLMLAVKKFLNEKKFDISPADVEVTLASTSRLVGRSTGDIRKMAHLMSKMARSEDTVH